MMGIGWVMSLVFGRVVKVKAFFFLGFFFFLDIIWCGWV
jgi:hypothetical protein